MILKLINDHLGDYDHGILLIFKSRGHASPNSIISWFPLRSCLHKYYNLLCKNMKIYIWMYFQWYYCLLLVPLSHDSRDTLTLLNVCCLTLNIDKDNRKGCITALKLIESPTCLRNLSNKKIKIIPQLSLPIRAKVRIIKTSV